MDFESQGAPRPPQRSTFVNVLAWLFIVLGGFTTFISILQNVMIRMMFHKEEMTQAIQQAENAKQMPAFVNFMFNHINLFFLFFLIVSATSLVSAIALLKRKNWARIVFIVLMSLGITWNLGGLVMQFILFSNIPDVASKANPPEFDKMFLIIKIASVTMVIVISALFGWVIKKLTSAPIKAEFC